MSGARFFRQWAWSTIAWAPVGILFVSHGYSLSTIHGRSMQPTLNPDSNQLSNDIVIINRWDVDRFRYHVGDVVLLKSPSDPTRIITKRIVAMEGDMVKTLPPYPEPLITIPPGHCWVEGDEMFHSRDSNVFGPVPLGLVKAKITWIVYPFHRFGSIPEKPRGSRIQRLLPEQIA